MILLTQFQAKQITFGCATIKSLLAVMYSGIPLNDTPMFCLYLTQKSFNRL